MQLSTAFDFAILKANPGYAEVSIAGKGAKKYHQEAGGHRWQRVPPTEKRGRVQTSTITVVVLDAEALKTTTLDEIDPKDLCETFTRGSGPGGQHRNKTETAVMLKHLPTGIMVRAEDNKSQKVNRENALMLLKAKLQEAEDSKNESSLRENRKEQAGSGMRGDKVRTVMVQHDQVNHHSSGSRCTYKDYTKGKIHLLWK